MAIVNLNLEYDDNEVSLEFANQLYGLHTKKGGRVNHFWQENAKKLYRTTTHGDSDDPICVSVEEVEVERL